MPLQPALYNEQGQWIAGSSSALSPTLSERDLAAATPIQVEGEIVGYVTVEVVGEPNSTEELVERVNRAIWLAALAAGVAALLIGGVLVVGLLKPVNALTSAAQELSQGDLSQRVPITTRDELGELSLAFNQMADNLERMEGQRRDLTADIAHELRNPLSVMQARLEGIIDGVYEPSPERLKSVLEQSRLLNRLVEDLRMLALADAGQLTLDRADTDLSSLATQAVEVYRTQAEEGDVRLSLDTPAPGTLVASVDPARMEQVLGNLLSNALRHTPPEGEMELAVGRRDGARSVLITVSDTGEGIPEESLPFVFDRFYRADRSRSRERGGTGLGLAITRELVEAHGGSIEASNRHGGGTVFSIELPYTN
jgi:signal transduction histidine kinase